ncbi:MAG: hypothetical protein HYV97_02725 [Bdellovibrio sp.]|nr:hypothetical protein [Bdellovibrio sp.]
MNSDADKVPFLWRFLRGDIETSEFEKALYNDASYEAFFGNDFFLDLIENNYHDKNEVHKLKEKLKAWLGVNYPKKCRCIELRDLDYVDMTGDSETGYLSYMNTIHEIKARGGELWWLYLARCGECQQSWLVASDTRINDIFILKRVEEIDVEKILGDDVWPRDFDSYADVLVFGCKSGKQARFADPMNSPSLAWTMIDIAKEKPGMSVSYFAKLLNVDRTTAIALAEIVMKTEGIVIKLED